MLWRKSLISAHSFGVGIHCVMRAETRSRRKMYPYPHTIDNGAGEQITFVGLVHKDDGEYLEVENRVKPGHGPIMHVHYHQDEALTVQQGKLGYLRAGEEPHYAGVGEQAVFKAGEAHRFWNAGQDDLICTGYATPPYNLEYFLTQLFDSTRRNGGKQPDPFEIAYLSTRYRSEFGVVTIPAFVQRTIFPILIMIGQMLGKYKRYADAPEPLVVAPISAW
jgi:uncharacterized cupin superfamily protein